jgi:hypothetical protein
MRGSRRLARILAANPRGAIYGTIVASATIATTAGGRESAALVLEATLAILLVFRLAHVYADFLGHGLGHARADLWCCSTTGRARLHTEWSMGESPCRGEAAHPDRCDGTASVRRDCSARDVAVAGRHRTKGAADD